MQSEIFVIFSMSIWKKPFPEPITFTFPDAFRLCVWKEQHLLPAAAQKNNKIISEEKSYLYGFFTAFLFCVFFLSGSDNSCKWSK